jgi:hypothetical protein
MSMIFWTTYTAYQRGESKENKDLILTHICKESGHGNDAWDRSPHHKAIWIDEHDRIVDKYLAKFRTYISKWIESDAGIAFQKHIKYNKLYLILSRANFFVEPIRRIRRLL